MPWITKAESEEMMYERVDIFWGDGLGGGLQEIMSYYHQVHRYPPNVAFNTGMKDQNLGYHMRILNLRIVPTRVCEYESNL